jgi:uncharacterized protein
MKRQLALLIVFVFAVAAPAAAAPKPTHIVVAGTGTVNLQPDQATVSASILTVADTAAVALSQNNKAYAQIAAALERTGVREDDIQFTSYNVSYNPRPNPPPANPPPYERYGFSVSRSFDILVRSVDKTGPVIDAATGAGATGISVAFGVAHPEQAKDRATALATANARSSAQVIARAAGLRIVGIASLRLDGAQGVLPQPAMRLQAAAEVPTVINPSSVTVTSSVTATYFAVPGR